MKTIVCLLLCSLVAITYAAPAQTKTNQAEAQFFGLLGGLLPKLIGGLLKGGHEVELQDDDDDVDFANIEDLISQSLADDVDFPTYAALEQTKTNQAEAQLLGIGSLALSILPQILGGLLKGGNGVELQDDDDDVDFANIEDLLRQSLQDDDVDLSNIGSLLSQGLEDNAEVEGMKLKKLGNWALKLANKIRVIGGGIERGLRFIPKIINALGGGVTVQDLANIEGLFGPGVLGKK